MKIVFSRKSLDWLKKNKINSDKLFLLILRLCSEAGKLPNKTLRLNIMPRAIHSYFDFYTNTLCVAVQSKALEKRYIKLSRVLRNMLHELRHFIQYRIIKKPFKLSYTYRDAELINSKYWNDPDEIDARKYEKKKLKFCYNLLIKQ
jgi:hypothetical protein